jgi:hypothetical protein
MAKRSEKAKQQVRLCKAISMCFVPAPERFFTKRHIRTPAAGLCGVELEKQEVQPKHQERLHHFELFQLTRTFSSSVKCCPGLISGTSH